MQMDSQTLLFDKDYGLQSGTFDSGVIYLPYVADRTIPYLVTLTVGDYVYAMPFMHQQARLVANNACTYGVRLNDLAVAFYGDWMMGTMVDLNALAGQGSMSVDICASKPLYHWPGHAFHAGFLAVRFRFLQQPGQCNRAEPECLGCNQLCGLCRRGAAALSPAGRMGGRERSGQRVDRAVPAGRLRPRRTSRLLL